jgi:acetyltransferase-like isoleucine patch superfamily enzyme
MKQSYSALIRYRLANVYSLIRIKYLRALGLQIGQGSIIGKIKCVWPKSIHIGSETTVQDNVLFHIAHPFYENNHIKIGSRVFIGQSCEFNCAAKIFIGDDSKVASNTTFVDLGHEIAPNITINKQAIISSDIVVCEDVWIGTRCIILKGVTIGKGSVIGAGSLVNKSVPEYQIWAGVPARFIRNR